MTTFFVPFTPSDAVEARYVLLAQRAGCFAAPPREERIASVSFAHNGEEWTAEVGKRLYGKRSDGLMLNGQQLIREHETDDPAVVLAIFPGNPYVVITDGGKAEQRISRWSDRFTVGRPFHVAYFGQRDPEAQGRSSPAYQAVAV